MFLSGTENEKNQVRAGQREMDEVPELRSRGVEDWYLYLYHYVPRKDEGTGLHFRVNVHSTVSLLFEAPPQFQAFALYLALGLLTRAWGWAVFSQCSGTPVDSTPSKL
jgi:hypothetical protein